jgi:acetyltransferase
MINLDSLFKPKNIAVIGASNNPIKLGYQILNNIKIGGFKGKIYPVNLKEKKILGLTAYADILNIKNPVDLVVIAIPAPFVLAEIKKCATAHVKNVIIISAGFGEIDEAGKKVEADIRAIAEKARINIVGPNCLGIISPPASLNATFATFSPDKSVKRSDNIAFISQSGAVGSAMMDFIAAKNIGLSCFISLGNAAALNENDFFEYFLNDKKTDLVVAYLEEIEEGEKFMAIVSRLAKIKPVAVLKAGKSIKGGAAALSHTGSLAGSSEVVAAGLRRAGVIILENMSELFNLMRLIKRPLVLKNYDLNIISNAGGPLVLTIDEAADANLDLNKTKDIIGDADAKRYQKFLSEYLADPKINNLLVLLTPQTVTEVEATAEVIGRLAKKYPSKLICTSFIGGGAVAGGKKILAKYMIPNYDYPEEAVRVLSHYLNYQKNLKNLKPFKYQAKLKDLVASEGILYTKDEQLEYLKSFQMLEKYGIPSVRTIKVTKDNFHQIEFPAVLKIVGKDIIHKTDKQAIFINVKNEDEAKEIFSKNDLLLNPENYLVAQKMEKSDLALILGFKRDKSFGPILMIGQGGIYTEIFKDVQLEVGDLDEGRALAMITKLKIYPILKGARGKAGYDLKTLAQILVKVAKLAQENPEIKEFDINPLFVRPEGFLAVDVRIII